MGLENIANLESALASISSYWDDYYYSVVINAASASVLSFPAMIIAEMCWKTKFVSEAYSARHVAKSKLLRDLPGRRMTLREIWYLASFLFSFLFHQKATNRRLREKET